MTTATETTRTLEIRRHIYEMLAILSVSVLILGWHYGWSQSSSDKLRHYANNYHLTTNSYYLKATQQLLLEHSRLSDESVKNNIDTELQAKILASPQVSNKAALTFIIRQNIKAGLELQRTFDDGRFGSLSATLERQASKYEESKRDYVQGSIAPDQVSADIKGLLTTLSQLIQLHSVSRDDQLAKLELKRKRQALIFYALLLVLLVALVLFTRGSLVAVAGIVSKQQQAEDIIKHQAHFDCLTNLPNRRLSLDRLTELINRAQGNKDKVAVLFLDLDDFKKVNDTLGHDIGDKLLIEAAGRLSRAMRSCSTAGRLGGDEFIIILGNITDVTDAQVIADSLIDEIKKVFKIDGREIILSVSVGISIYPEDSCDASTLLRNAHSAMYHSKALGRNTYSYFTDAMNRSASRRLALEEQLHGALDRGELTVFYQLQVDLGHSNIVGAEALLRWSNPTLGSVSPEEFIPIAEQTGLIVPIGRFVLSEALNMTARWQREQDPEFRIAVNVSPRQLRDHQLVSHIEKAMLQSGISSQSLELEITEGVLMSGHNYIDHALTKLSNIGVSIAMDDFGTGYSSISYLRRYPFDVVKVDRSFIRDIDVDSEIRELINAAISMAHALNLKVVAEGVETEEQLAYLKDLGCDYAQGYLFGKPISGEDTTEVLKSGITNQANARSDSTAAFVYHTPEYS